MTSFLVRHDVIYHFFPINSQYLMMWVVDSPADTSLRAWVGWRMHAQLIEFIPSQPTNQLTQPSIPFQKTHVRQGIPPHCGGPCTCHVNNLDKDFFCPRYSCRQLRETAKTLAVSNFDILKLTLGFQAQGNKTKEMYFHR